MPYDPERPIPLPRVPLRAWLHRTGAAHPVCVGPCTPDDRGLARVHYLDGAVSCEVDIRFEWVVRDA